jgi:hypothetical protein
VRAHRRSKIMSAFAHSARGAVRNKIDKKTHKSCVESMVSNCVLDRQILFLVASAIANGIAGADCKVQTDSCEVNHAANDNGQIGDDVLLDKMDKIVIKVICDVN